MKSVIGMLLFILGCATAAAQGYPNHAVKIIVPFPPGSGPDLIARIIGQQLQEDLRQNFIIDNRGGAQGSIAATEVARAAPDGSTVIVPTNTTHAANPSLFTTIA